MTLGLDISDGAARAVVVNAQAVVLARGEQRIEPGAAPQAARAAVGRALGETSGAVTGAAVAMPHPGDAAQDDVDAVLRDLLPGTPPPDTVAAGVAVAVAEQWCGAARGLSEVVVLSAGEHVTSGIILDGKPWMGAHGMAGSVSWLSINPVEREDYRRLGCLEAEIGSSGIVRRLVWRLKSGDRSRVLDMAGGDMSAMTVVQVFDAARDGDGVAASVVRDTARYVGMAIGNLVAVIDPEVVVLGGLMADAADLLLEPARLEAGRRMPAHASRTVRIDAAALGADAGALGAARAAMLAT
jgi:predicted NBD/HSP70 family sugar kinase